MPPSQSNSDTEALLRERDYLLKEINRQRCVMQEHGWWDEFCAAYAKRYGINAEIQEDE